jgi:hypothetical protein
MAHLHMASDSPPGVIASRLEESLGEGIADYYAAAIQSSPLLGRIGEKAARDLSERPIWLRGGWAKLTKPAESWNAHEQGWALAALLWSQEKEVGPLLRDLISCMQSASLDGSDRVASVIDAWLRGCPQESQEEIAQLLRRWIPSTAY